MKEFKLDKGIVYYIEELDGGGTTFGINCLKSEPVLSKVRRGNILEMCSGPGFMGFYLNFEGYADNLLLSDLNAYNRKYILNTIEKNSLDNTEFLHSNGFTSISSDIIFDTIISNPPHFATPKPNGYRSLQEKLITYDSDMDFHKKFLIDAKKHMHKDSIIILIENATGINSDDIIGMAKNDYEIEVGVHDKYGWPGESTFYPIFLKLK